MQLGPGIRRPRVALRMTRRHDLVKGLRAKYSLYQHFFPGMTMSEAPEKKKRSPVERLIVWGLIGVLLAVVFVEYRASKNFQAAYDYLDNMKPSEHPTLDDLKGQLSGASVSEKMQDDLGTDEVELSFFSFFKSDKYKLRLQLADIPKGADQELAAKLSAGGGTVVHFYQPDLLAQERNRKIEVPEVIDDELQQPTGQAGAGGGGGGGGGAVQQIAGLEDTDESVRPGDDGPEANGGGPGTGGGGGRPGGGRGRGGRRGGRGMSAIASNDEVKSKLNITDEQAAKIKELAEANQIDFASMRGKERSEIMATFAESRSKIEDGIKEIVDAEQFDTLQRMTWAQEGPMALAREAVVTKLGLTEDQVAALAKLREGMDFRNPPIDEMLSVLNDEQKTKWSGLIEGMEPPAPPESNRSARPALEE